MRKSIQTRLVLIFVLIILATMLVLGTYLFNSIAAFYHDDFRTQMEEAFTPDRIQQCYGALNTADPVGMLEELLTAISGQLGTDSYRHFYLLDGKTGNYISGPDRQGGEIIDKSENILSAMNGKIGNEGKITDSYMDYALPIPAENPQFIIYIRDSKTEMSDFLKSMLKILLQALFFGLLITAVFGYFLSRTITTPIIGLTRRAEKLAKGEFEKIPSVQSDDELGMLYNTFKYMADTLKITLEEIAFEKNKLEKIMQYMSDGIIAFDTNGKILLINEVAKEFLQAEDEIQISFDDYFGNLFDDIYLGDFLYLYKERRIERVAEINDSTYKFCFGTFLFENKKPGGVIVSVQDITKQQKLEKSRREFVANVSHELKTPITTIKSYVETIMENELDRETELNFLNVVNRESDRMTRLIQDLLTLSRLDGRLLLKSKEPLDLSDLISEVVEKQSFEAKKRGHKLSFHQLGEIPPVYIARDRLEQILTNVLSNAIKYTPDGGTIEIFAKKLYTNVYIKVKDNGIGIPAKDLDRIFERFYRVDKARSRDLGGTGLGLAISKEFIQAYGGDITIESVPNEGTEVSITLPLGNTEDSFEVTKKNDSFLAEQQKKEM